MAVIAALSSLAIARTPATALTMSFITSPLPSNGAVATAYLHQFTATAQVPAMVFTLASGSLPPGLLLLPTGFVTGTPLKAGVYGPTTVCASNGVAPSACQTFTIVVSRRTPGVLTASSFGGPVGTRVRNTATVLGGVMPTGSVTFHLYRGDCRGPKVFTSVNVLDRFGIATSDDFTPFAPGTYRWVAAYSGDVNHNRVTTPCDPSNQVTITGSSLSLARKCEVLHNGCR